MNKYIRSKDAPAAIGPYSQAVMVENQLFISGQIPLNPQTGRIEESDVRLQALQVFKNIEAILKKAGCSKNDVVKTTCFICDMNDFQTVNEVYGEFFEEGHYPARSAIEVSKLPKNAKVKIEATAFVSDQKEV